MNQLERRYRLVLRMLPAAYRHQWEDDMVAAFLTSMEDDDPEHAEFLADFGRPSWSEIASVAALALRLHCGLTGVRSPRTDARSDTARIIVLLWLLFGAAWAFAGVGVQLWAMGALGVLPAPPPEVTAAPLTASWHVVWQVAGLAWPVAFLALVFGRPTVVRTAALLGLAANALGIALATVDAVANNLAGPSWSSLVLFAVDVCLLGALWTFAAHWPPILRRPWLLSLVGSSAAVTGLMVGAIGGVLPWWALDPVNISAIAVLAVVVVRLAAGASPSWWLALAVLTWGMLAVRVLTLAEVADIGPWTGFSPWTLAAAEALALLVAAVPATILAVRAQSRLASSA